MRSTPSNPTFNSRSSNNAVSRRSALRAIVASGLVACVHVGFADERDESLALTISDSLDALANRQNEDGSFGAKAELFGRDPAVSALCGLAFLASGSLPGRGRYGTNLDKIVEFISSRALRTKGKTSSEAFTGLDATIRSATLDYLKENNLTTEDVDGLIVDFTEKGRKPMYGHGFATLFLAEISGQVDRPDLRDTIRAAVELILRVQNSAGGWRYEPKQAAVADLSVTTCLLSSLRSAHNAGFHIPQESVKNTEKYVLSLQNQDGGFRYMFLDGPSGYARTATAIHALQASGKDNSKAIERGFEYLEKVYPVGSEATQKDSDIEYWSYGQFYAALSYWRAAIDEESRKRAQRFFRRLTQDALARRSPDGMWRSAISSEVETAFILCALLVPKEQTPFFLR